MNILFAVLFVGTIDTVVMSEDFPDLLVVEYKRLVYLNSSTGNGTVLVAIKEEIYDVDYITETSSIYFSVSFNENVTLNKIVVNESYIGEPERLYEIDNKIFKIDWINLKVYTLSQKSITVHELEGNERKTFPTNCNGFLIGLAIDPLARLMFWSCMVPAERAGYIQVSGMDGVVSYDHIFNDSMIYPMHLVPDYSNRRIYWYDMMLMQISSDTYEKTDRVVHKNNVRYEMSAFSIYDNQMFVIDLIENSCCQVLKCAKMNISRCERIHTTKTVIANIQLYDRALKPEGNNACDGKCKYFCLPSLAPDYYRCYCPDHYLVTSSGECEPPPLFLITGNRYVTLIDINGKILENSVIANFYSSERNDMDYMFKNHMIFWTQDYSRNEDVVKFNQDTKTKITIEIGPVDYIVADWITNKLYYIQNGEVSVVEIDGTLRKTLTKNPNDKNMGWSVRSQLSLDPSEGLMFWICEKGSLKSMERADMTGKHTYTIINSTLATSFSVDVQEKRIYWTSKYTPLLASSNYDGQNYMELLTKLGTPPYINVHSPRKIQNYVYFVSKKDIYSFDISTTHYQKIMSLDVEDIHGLKVYHGVMQPNKFSPCNVDNGNCTHLCLLSSAYPYYECACPDGFISVADGDHKTCQNLYPCYVGNGGCSHVCRQTDNSPYFYCDCPTGVTLRDDNRTCSAKEFEKVFIVTTASSVVKMWINNDSVTRLDLKFTSDERGRIRNTIYDPDSQQIYWNTGFERYATIKRSDFKGKGCINLVLYSQYILSMFKDSTVAPLCIMDIEIDWIRQRFYFSTKFPEEIFVTQLDGKNKLEIQSASDGAIALSFDQFNGNLYFISGNSFITKLGTDDRDISVVIRYACSSTGGYDCKQFNKCDLLVDYRHTKIYWSDGLDIEVANIDGTGRMVLMTTKNELFTVFASGDLLYWSDGTNIYQKALSKNITSEVAPLSQLQDIADVHQVTIVNNKNGIQDCPTYAKCLGLKAHTICLDSSMVCDGTDDCYGGHDEIYCSICDDLCYLETISLKCEMTSFQLQVNSDAFAEWIAWSSHPFSKFSTLQDIIGSKCRLRMKLAGFNKTYNGLKTLFFPNFSIERIIRQIILSPSLRNLTNIRKLYLRGGHLLSFIDNATFTSFDKLQKLSITHSSLSAIPKHLFGKLSDLKYLNISYNAIKFIEPGSLDKLVVLHSIDMRGNKIPFTPGLFERNIILTHIYTDLFTFCCIKPESVTEQNCVAPEDSISSCSDLIKHDVLKVFLWIMGLIAITVNILALIVHLHQRRKKKVSNESFHIFVHHLGIADTVMGIYMIIIAAHDLKFRGHYFAFQHWWVRSVVCKLSGVMAMASSESSVMFICLITVDRFLAVKFPFKSIRMTKRFANMSVFIVWLVSAALAVIPLFLYDEFYSKSGVCMALPLTTNAAEDFQYSVSVFLGLNFALFLIVIIGQIAIYTSLQKSSFIISDQQESRNKMVAIMLFCVAMTDALCWLPIAVVGIISLNGVVISNDVYAWFVVFVLPVNSAINPFIYTLLAVFRSIKKNLPDSTTPVTKSSKT